MVDGVLRGVERDLRHAARAHPGPRQARGRARPARAAAPARGAASDRARLGDAPLPAPDGSGALVVVLDLRTHEALVEHSGGGVRRIPLTPEPAGRRGHARAAARRSASWRATSRSTRRRRRCRGARRSTRTTSTRSYDPGQVAAYFAAATHAALVLAAFRAPYRGRSTPVNAWWGSFDLAVNLFSGLPADPPSEDFIMRNAMDAQEVAVGWWPGDARYAKAAFYAYAHPAPDGFAAATLSPAAARWDATLGEYVLDWDDAAREPRPARPRARVRALGVPPRLRGVRVGSGAPRQRRRDAAARRVMRGRGARWGRAPFGVRALS